MENRHIRQFLPSARPPALHRGGGRVSVKPLATALTTLALLVSGSLTHATQPEAGLPLANEAQFKATAPSQEYLQWQA